MAPRGYHFALEQNTIMHALRMRSKLCSSRMKYGSMEAPMEVWKCVRKERMGWPFSATVFLLGLCSQTEKMTGTSGEIISTKRVGKKGCQVMKTGSNS